MHKFNSTRQKLYIICSLITCQQNRGEGKGALTLILADRRGTYSRIYSTLFPKIFRQYCTVALWKTIFLEKIQLNTNQRKHTITEVFSGVIFFARLSRFLYFWVFKCEISACTRFLYDCEF